MIDFNRLKNLLRLFFPAGRAPWLTNLKNGDLSPQRILCIVPSGMGDVIMDAPAVHALKLKFPDARISVLVHYNLGGDEVCRLMKSVDETIDMGLKGYRWGQVIIFMLGGFWKLLFKLRRKRFDLVVVFWPNPIRRLLLAWMGAGNWIYGMLTDEYPGEQDAKLLKLIGIEKIDTADACSVFQVPQPANPEQILPMNLPRPIICVHPFCGMQWRQWQKFDQLQVELAKLNGSVVAVGKKTGYQTPKGVHSLVGKLSIAELFWVIKNCDVFVAADSGPMHISFALGKPTVALFGPVAPALRLPPGWEKRVKVIYKESAGSKTARHATFREKLDNTAMQSITVEEVVEAVKKLLAGF